jgi:hypothetical protein
MSAVVLMDDLTQTEAGRFASVDEAMSSPEWQACAHPVTVPAPDVAPIADCAPAWAADAEMARQYAWVAAARAKRAGLRDAFKACRAQAQELETVHSPHGKVLSAIFGGCPVRGYEALALRGRKLGVTAQLAAEAKAFVSAQ